ncbi:MAG: AbrB/MazE/SpoVT family DNA-binding domain-containing protein [Chloroflexi bacterium]|nr:AbrB/MazE/SpoVT family DNA-binding domain-containing protein [Chloroflexota bacterium]
MRISKRGQITIPKHLRDRFGMHHNTEVEIRATEEGLLVQKRAAVPHPVDRVAGILDRVDLDVDRYIEDIRGL